MDSVDKLVKEIELEFDVKKESLLVPEIDFFIENIFNYDQRDRQKMIGLLMINFLHNSEILLKEVTFPELFIFSLSDSSSKTSNSMTSGQRDVIKKCLVLIKNYDIYGD